MDNEMEIGQCQCEWVHPVDGSIDSQWPAELAPHCVVHAGESPATLVSLLKEAGARKMPNIFGVKNPRGEWWLLPLLEEAPHRDG